MASLNALSESDAAAVARYKETAALSRGRLAEIQAEAAAHARAGGSSSHNEAEWMARYATEGPNSGLAGSQAGLLLTRLSLALVRMSWLCTMLLNTSEEALRAKHALMRAREQHIADQLQASQTDAAEERSAAEVLRRDRQALEQNMAELGSKQRRQAMEGQQQRTRDGSRLQTLQEQLRQLQTSARLAEAAWKEERRAEIAASSQRERNVQVRLTQQ